MEDHKNKQEELEIKRKINELREKLRYGEKRISQKKKKKTEGEYVKERNLNVENNENELNLQYITEGAILN